jgi:hypothetical protein
MKKSELCERLERVEMRSNHNLKYKVLFSESESEFSGTKFFTVLLIDRYMEVKRFDYINEGLHRFNNATVYEVEKMKDLFKEGEI